MQQLSGQKAKKRTNKETASERKVGKGRKYQLNCLKLLVKGEICDHS